MNKTTKENLEDIDWVEEQEYYKDDEHFESDIKYTGVMLTSICVDGVCKRIFKL